MDGIIGNLRLEQNYGFIEVVGESDVFFHRGSISPDLEWDEQLLRRRVEFQLIETGKGPSARNVRPAP